MLEMNTVKYFWPIPQKGEAENKYDDGATRVFAFWLHQPCMKGGLKTN